ncbi:MAG: superoxide dismutase family protein [Sphingomonadales bacterium]|nr:superoxide dismutase family protein [Sphingomonadales bacterium]
MNISRLIPLAALIAAPASADVLGVDLNGPAKAKATVIDSQGRVIGKAEVKNLKDSGLRVTISVRGLPRGEHGVHIHAIGACEGPKFTSAGPHWNPHAKMHGLQNQDGAHAGDMPNLQVNKKGKGKLVHEIADGRVKGDFAMMDEDGAAIVIHAQTDDQRTDPSGNSGDRIACGVFVK